ncbi:hypothetical protein Glove_374g10 [Diversispora epigaea]|uniref:Uncharacterized protein n=1 Tax=Diversispora epigaea TaxID=1348612 RepID=A0A397H5F1_9GLOM|nr:hypothetical protein Glove_374g10 [Diversispora epigaea]
MEENCILFDEEREELIEETYHELTSTVLEQTTTITSYLVKATETDPEPIDFFNLYHKITSAKCDQTRMLLFNTITSGWV